MIFNGFNLSHIRIISFTLCLLFLIGLYINNINLKSKIKDLEHQNSILTNNIDKLNDNLDIAKKLSKTQLDEFNEQISTLKKLLDTKPKVIYKDTIKIPNCEVKILKDNKTEILESIINSPKDKK